eukprot:1501965-Pyramimonas_sp.AAC.1
MGYGALFWGVPIGEGSSSRGLSGASVGHTGGRDGARWQEAPELPPFQGPLSAQRGACQVANPH